MKNIQVEKPTWTRGNNNQANIKLRHDLIVSLFLVDHLCIALVLLFYIFYLDICFKSPNNICTYYLISLSCSLDWEEMDHSIVDTAMTSRKRKREEYKKIILLAAACVVHMVIGVVTWYHNNYFVKEPTRNWELERHSFLNRLYRWTNKDCIEQLRLSKNAFFNLCRILQEKGGLVRTRNVPTTEAVAMFLHILAHNLKYRVMQFSYCRSKETISRQFNDVLRVVMKVSKDYLNFQPCTLEGAEANKWRWFEVSLSIVRRD